MEVVPNHHVGTRGARRRRESPDPRPLRAGESSTSCNNAEERVSPSSQRIVKRARTRATAPTLSATAPPFIPRGTRQPARSPSPSDPESDDTTTPDGGPAQITESKRGDMVVQFLRSALAHLEALPTPPDEAATLTQHIAERLGLAIPAPSPSPSRTASTSAPTSITQPRTTTPATHDPPVSAVAATSTPPSARAPVRPYVAKRSSEKRARREPATTSAQLALKPRDNAHRLVIMSRNPCLVFPDPHKRPFPNSILGAVNRHLPRAARVAAVTYTRAGQLALHVKPPYTAAMLAQHDTALCAALKEVLKLPDPPTVDLVPANKWHKVVIHDIPIPPVTAGPDLLPTRDGHIFPDPSLLEARQMATKAIAPTLEAVEKSLYALGGVRHIPQRRLLCSEVQLVHKLDERYRGSSQYVSLMVSLMEEEPARALLRDGLFTYGTHCRVSPYRPRSHSHKD